MKKFISLFAIALLAIFASCTKVEPTTLEGKTNCSVLVNITDNFMPGAILTLKYAVGSDKPAVQTIIMPSQSVTVPLHCPPASVLKVSATCGAGEYVGTSSQVNVFPGQQIKLEIKLVK